MPGRREGCAQTSLGKTSLKYIIYYDSVLHRQLFKCTKKGTQINVQLHQKLKKITKKLTAQKMITNKCPITTNAQIKIKKELIGQKIQQKALKRKKKSLKLMRKNIIQSLNAQNRKIT